MNLVAVSEKRVPRDNKSSVDQYCLTGEADLCGQSTGGSHLAKSLVPRQSSHVTEESIQTESELRSCTPLGARRAL